MFEERLDERVAVSRRANFESHLVEKEKIYKTSDAGERGAEESPQNRACFRRVFYLPAPVGGNLIPGDNGWETRFQRSCFTGELRRTCTPELRTMAAGFTSSLNTTTAAAERPELFADQPRNDGKAQNRLVITAGWTTS